MHCDLPESKAADGKIFSKCDLDPVIGPRMTDLEARGISRSFRVSCFDLALNADLNLACIATLSEPPAGAVELAISHLAPSRPN